MADPIPQLTDAWRRLSHANTRYYSGYARLLREYVDDVIGSMQGAPVATGGPLGATNGPAARAAEPPSPAARPLAMALEGELGCEAVGAFVVENGLRTNVHAPLVAASFVDPDGKGLTTGLVFEPAEIDLDPGAQLLVRVKATIDESLEPGVVYRGEVTVPGLPGTRIGIVLRRTPTA